MKLYLATGNLHKKIEMARIFTGFDIVIPKEEGIVFNPDETGKSFFENSLIKAKALWDIVHEPVIADDSGICVDALNGAPGIYSSRYAGPQYMKGRADGVKIPQEEQNKFLVEQTNAAIAENPELTRTCRYVCSLVCYFGKDRFYCAQETMEGLLVANIKDAAGNGGFGYDPLVIIPKFGKTVAELTDSQKDEISHRGKAARALYQSLQHIKNIK
ncbi:MAG: non-canonical purine NTP pyrophosphatase [Treponema sp.]|nr:non-canonical purine NTP pyrophosphatase [Treponema sp.]